MPKQSRNCKTFYVKQNICENDDAYFRPGPPEFTEELRMRQETDGVLLESFLIYEPEHAATWYKDDNPLLGALDFDEKYQPFLERRGDWTYCALAIR